MKAIKISLICLAVLLLNLPCFAGTLGGAYTYLCSQVKGIGIVDSYNDAYSDSYTYDNALAVMAFAAKGDYARARTILDAFQNKIGLPLYGGYYDVYDYTTGVGRGDISVGPNAWLLDAINLYYYKTNDPQFSVLAQALADYLVGLQDVVDGGLFGDEYVSWKSTEHNLAAYVALYNYGMLNSKSLYAQKANLIKNFIALNCWNGERFLRGQNDPVEVTDTQALGVLSLGTTYASAIYWAEYHTKCTKQLGRLLSVTGFDFNNDLDTVWLEGTLQQAMAFKKNYDDYRAGIYFNNVDKTQMSSGSFLCATNTGTTGTDWVLSPVESVAPTCWYVLYSTDTNPLAVINVMDSSVIQAAMDAAPIGGTVSIDPGVYIFNANLNIKKNITIKAKDPNVDRTIFRLGNYCIFIKDSLYYSQNEYYYQLFKNLNNVTIDGITIRGYRGSSTEGAIQNYSGKLTLKNCKIIDNQGIKVGAIYSCWNSKLYLENTLVAKNKNLPATSVFPYGSRLGQTVYAGTIYLSGTSTLNATNSTIAGNINDSLPFTIVGRYNYDYFVNDGLVHYVSIQVQYGAIYRSRSSKSLYLTNSILWGNGINAQDFAGRVGATSAQLINCDTESTTYNVIHVNPQFVDPENCNYNISDTSPCKGTGTNGTDIGAKFLTLPLMSPLTLLRSLYRR